MYYKGYYRLFYQYNPDAAVWGHIAWGHAVSTALMHWLYLENALEPDQWYDDMGVWSGSATNGPDDVPFILYTGKDSGGAAYAVVATCFSMTVDTHPSFPFKKIFYGLVTDSCTTLFERTTWGASSSLLEFFAIVANSIVSHTQIPPDPCEMSTTKVILLCLREMGEILRLNIFSCCVTGGSNETGHCNEQTQNMAVPADPEDPLLRKWVKVKQNPIVKRPELCSISMLCLSIPHGFLRIF
jgi:hypothetical protein